MAFAWVNEYGPGPLRELRLRVLQEEDPIRAHRTLERIIYIEHETQRLVTAQAKYDAQVKQLKAGNPALPKHTGHGYE